MTTNKRFPDNKLPGLTVSAKTEYVKPENKEDYVRRNNLVSPARDISFLQPSLVHEDALFSQVNIKDNRVK